MTQETPDLVSVRRVIRGLLSDYGQPFGVNGELLVAMVYHETDADALTIRPTIDSLERTGEIYNASGDPDAPLWKVTRT